MGNNIADINYIIHESLKGDKKYQEILLKKLHPLIYSNIYKYYNCNNSLIEDLVQEGYVVILECLNNYDKNYNVHFLGYVKNKLYYFYKNYYRNTKKIRDSISLNDLENSDFEEVDINEIFDINDEILKEEEISELLNNIKKISKREQLIIKMFYEDEITIKNISKKLNISYRTVAGTKYSAIRKLKKFMHATRR